MYRTDPWPARDHADIWDDTSGERRGETQQAARSHEVLLEVLFLTIFALHGGAVYAIP